MTRFVPTDATPWRPLRQTRPRGLRLTPHQLVVLTLEGDTSLMHPLRSTAHEVLLLDCDGHDLVVTGHGVARVVERLRDGELDPAVAQRWAAFVAHGWVDKGCRPVRPLALSYDPDDVIAEVLAALEAWDPELDETPSEATYGRWLEALTDPRRCGSAPG